MTEPLSAVGPDGAVLGDEPDIPEGVLKLIGGDDHRLHVKSVSPHSCVLTAWTRQHEFRFQKRGADDWEWDEVVGAFHVHIEQMSDSAYWIGLHPIDDNGEEIGDDRVCVDIVNPSGRAPVRMTGWLD